MIGILFALSMLLYSPLLIYSALNYLIIITALIIFTLFISKKSVVSLRPLVYFGILLLIFVINYSFGHERNTPWFFNHIAYVLFSYIVCHIYLKQSELKRNKSLDLMEKINDLICVLVVSYVLILLLFLSDGVIQVIAEANWNGLLFIGTERFGMPKGQLSAITAYCLIWLALTRSNLKFTIYLVAVLVVLLAGRSAVIGLAVALFYNLFRLIPKKILIKFSVLILGFLALVIALIFIPADALYFDRAANFMVALDLANEDLFGHGNGTYHFYVEQNQLELNKQYSYLFSKYQVEVFLGPESMFNHIIGSFGYILGFVFFVLQGWSLWWAHKLYLKVPVVERFYLLFWFSCFVAGIGQTQIMLGFPYFFIWALVIAIIFRERAALSKRKE